MRGNLEAGQVDVIDARLAQSFRQIGLINPQPDARKLRT